MKFFLARLFSAVLLLALVYFIKDDIVALRNFNQALFFSSLIDFGFQAFTLMKMVHKRAVFLYETAYVTIMVMLLGMLFSWSVEFILLVLLLNYTNIVAGIANGFSVIKYVLLVSFIRVSALYVILILTYPIELLILFILVVGFLMTAQYGDFNPESQIKKRFELGILSVSGIILEQALRVGDGVSFSLTILILMASYFGAFTSIMQNSLLHYYFSSEYNNKHEERLYNLNFVTTLFLLVFLFSVGLVLVFLYIFDDISALLAGIVTLSIFSNFVLRYSITLSQMEVGSVRFFVYFGILTVIISAVFFANDMTPMYLQFSISLLALVFAFIFLRKRLS